MVALARRSTPYALVAAISIWLSLNVKTTGDWSSDGYPAVRELVHGHVGAYLSAKAMMGPFATLLQAPLVAISGAAGLAAYGWAAFPCLLFAGLLGVHLAQAARQRGQGRQAQAILLVGPLLNPLTFEALRMGHPEEVLTAALAVWAVVSASENRPRRTALLLGLALASKQWAVIAILPAVMALSSRRVRTAIAAGGIAVALILPGFIAAPEAFFGVQRQAAGTGRLVDPWSAWYPFASSRTEAYEVDGERLVAHIQEAPPGVDSLSHPLIVLLAFAIPVCLALSRRRFRLAGSEAMALLALLALLRCVLDPVDNLYYQEPLLLALFGWDALSERGAPLRSLLGVAAALLLWRLWHGAAGPGTLNAVYLASAGGAGVLLASSLFNSIRWTSVPVSPVFAIRSPNFRD